MGEDTSRRPGRAHGERGGVLVAIEDPLEKLAHMRLGNGKPPGAVDPEFAAKYPRLFVCMTATRTGKGYIKEPCTLSIKQGLATFTVTLRDETYKATLSVPIDRLEDVWQALEDELKADLPAWTPMRGKGVQELRKARPVE